MNNTPRCLLVDDEPDILKTLSSTFGLMNPPLECVIASNVTEACAKLEQYTFDICITDFDFRYTEPNKSGLELIKHITLHYPHIKTTLITAFGSEEIQIDALKEGAFDYLTKPLNLTYLKNTILYALNSPKISETKIIGFSKIIRELRDTVTKYGQTQAPVYIRGESGSGKELVARSIHEQSSRRDKPFIGVNCGAIPPDLMESELFGHKKGSFTGAYTDKIGLFKAAHGGTLFLDEVSDLPMNMQVKLLRVLQEREIRPVGAIQDISIDVRIISATNGNLEEMVKENRFRKDLFYRLNVLSIHVPPLRDHIEDVIPLSEHILSQLIIKNKSQPIKLSKKAVLMLKKYDFPGNVRELNNILERAMALCEENVIKDVHLQLPKSILAENTRSSSILLAEKKQVLEALLKTQGKVKAAADMLSISFESMRYRMRKYDLSKSKIRDLLNKGREQYEEDE